MKRILAGIFGLLLLNAMVEAGTVRGFVYDQSSGEAIYTATVTFVNAKRGAYCDENGFYVINDVAPGTYVLAGYFYGYDSSFIEVTIEGDEIHNLNFYLKRASESFRTVQVNAARKEKQTTIHISQNTIRPKTLQRIPSVGGEPDLVQYLQVLPGVVFSGDQGGQLYIRGGSPVMNRVMMDGLTVYNPFHSIGLFSVFDSDILKSADVFSAGFSAEYGGRVSAIIDVKTRDGNAQRFAGKVNSSPFNSKILLEGPLKQFHEGKGSSSFLLSYKNSYLDRSAQYFYPYINSGQLPYSFADLFGKISVKAPNGSHFKAFGFNFNDKVNFINTTTYDWKANGAGIQFLLIPGASKTVVDGNISYSDYFITQKEGDNKPRNSNINGYDVALNFTNYLKENDKLTFGLETNGFRTDFLIYNSLGRKISQYQNTTQVSAYINYLKIFKDKLVLEMGFRIQRYASLQENSPEPRLRLKYNIGPRFRFKASTGLYSQNLMSAVSDRDVVNLFYGFLSGPENLPKEFDGERVISKLQKARHLVAGFEFDPTYDIEFNIEGYVKDFTQITNVNRDKIFDNNVENTNRPDALKQDFIIESGLAYGYDITMRYEKNDLYVWFVYSYNNVSRYDGIRSYQPHFDRRHNINLVSTYDFGEEKSWNASMRWNFGSGFPFTLTQGFYELLSFSDGASTDYTTANGDLGILYGELNTGRLPYFHRLDVSIRKTIVFEREERDNTKMQIIASATNVYNRANIFYFDRVAYSRVNQLPFLPSISVSYSF